MADGGLLAFYPGCQGCGCAPEKALQTSGSGSTPVHSCTLSRPKGAEVAAWKQAARAELAKLSNGVDYAQVLLDLVKAFDRIPHDVLLR